MLVLSRKAGEQVVIDSGIRLTVVSIDGGRVRIGIDAPPDVAIVRQELLDALADQAERPRHATV